jgi:DNA-binding transcriptional ArsR family regulator
LHATAIWLRGSQLSRANSSAHAELFTIELLAVSALGLKMVAAANLVEVAALVGDTARATMLNALMGGQSLTATELAFCANVSRATASGHLSKLVAARLLTVTRNRRFSYYRIASPLVATMLESILPMYSWLWGISYSPMKGCPNRALLRDPRRLST